jgi:hypothetical protein
MIIHAGEVSSIDDYLLAQKQLIAYPNPSSGILHLDFENSDLFMVSIHDLTGKTVFQCFQCIEIQHNIPSGLYLHRLVDQSDAIYQ